MSPRNDELALSRTAGNSRADISTTVFVAALAAAELAIAGALLHAVFDLWTGLLVHAAIIAIGTALLVRNISDERDFAMIALLATALSGPFGGVGALALQIWIGRLRAGGRNTDLDAWYDELSGRLAENDAERICAALRNGRALRTSDVEILNFAAAIATGTPEEKQAALGAIGLNYHPDLLPVLQLAIASSDPVVRVQAAAVFAKLREGQRERLRGILCRHKNGHQLEPLPRGQRLATARALRDCAISGFLDDAERGRAIEAARNLCRKLLEARSIAPEDELDICRILNEIGAHGIAADHLADRADRLSPELNAVLIESLMHQRRTSDLARLLATLKHRRIERAPDASDEARTGRFNARSILARVAHLDPSLVPSGKARRHG